MTLLIFLVCAALLFSGGLILGALGRETFAAPCCDCDRAEDEQ